MQNGKNNSPSDSERMRDYKRKGAVAVLAAILMIPMMALVSFAVDYGYLLQRRTELQRAADTAVLSALQDLVPDDTGFQDLTVVKARLRQYVEENLTQLDHFHLYDADIEIGRFDPATVYTNFTILKDGIFDTIRVTLRRDGGSNPQVNLFFAPILGINSAPVVVTATGVLQKPVYLPPGADILPFAIPQSEWDSLNKGDVWSIYGDGSIVDDLGNSVPGNWGTLDIGDKSNSSADLKDQIRNGLRQSDLDALAGDGRIPSSQHIQADSAFSANGDTGVSGTVVETVLEEVGKTKLVPVYDTVTKLKGSAVEYHIVKWAVVEIVDAYLEGNKKSYVKVKKSHGYIGTLEAHPDLTNVNNLIDDAFTTPVLVK